MDNKEKYVIFLFHRDLRLYDHRPLQSAIDMAKGTDAKVLPIFIFTPEQVSKAAPLRSLQSIACLIQSLKELGEDLKKLFNSELFIFYGKNGDVVADIVNSVNVIGLVETKDYTPYSIKREGEFKEICAPLGIDYLTVHDLYLLPPGSIRTSGGKGSVYQKFTPFYDVVKNMQINDALGLVNSGSGGGSSGSGGNSGSGGGGGGGVFSNKNVLHSCKYISTISSVNSIIFSKVSSSDMKMINNRKYKGGRAEGLELLNKIPVDYAVVRDLLYEETSGLSVHHHNGTISIRESYWKSEQIRKNGHPDMISFSRQLFWRDFYAHIMYYFKELYGVGPFEFQSEKKWFIMSQKKKDIYEKWCNGETGVALVDAGMRQLNNTGFMHNRVRLVCASWLVKDMGIHWRLGERYFAQKLLDYDFTQNMLNWAGVASKLPFGAAPFRRHDPERTASRLDPDNKYISYWLGVK